MTIGLRTSYRDTRESTCPPDSRVSENRRHLWVWIGDGNLPLPKNFHNSNSCSLIVEFDISINNCEGGLESLHIKDTWDHHQTSDRVWHILLDDSEPLEHRRVSGVRKHDLWSLSLFFFFVEDLYVPRVISEPPEFREWWRRSKSPSRFPIQLRETRCHKRELRSTKPFYTQSCLLFLSLFIL